MDGWKASLACQYENGQKMCINEERKCTKGNQWENDILRWNSNSIHNDHYH